MNGPARIGPCKYGLDKFDPKRRQILYSNQGGVNPAPHTPCNDLGRPISPRACIVLFFSLLSIRFAHPTRGVGRSISTDLVVYLFFVLFSFFVLFPFFFSQFSFSLFLFSLFLFSFATFLKMFRFDFFCLNFEMRSN
jgi:hypothetical protein